MSLLLQQLVLVIALGGADRIRGDHYDFLFNRTSDRILYGWLMAALFGHPWDALTAPIVLAMSIGMAPGWGNAIGPALAGIAPDPARAEWWQRGILLRNAWLALAARGVIWGLPFVPLVWLDPRLVLAIPAYAAAMPLAVWIANRREADGIGDWERQERLRGWLAGGLIAAGLNGWGWYGLV